MRSPCSSCPAPCCTAISTCRSERRSTDATTVITPRTPPVRRCWPCRWSRRPPRDWTPLAAALALALLGHLVYDLARFGNPFETGYGAQATLAAYTTPMVVGLYGLLISSGKGVLWFAPALSSAPWGWRAMWS